VIAALVVFAASLILLASQTGFGWRRPLMPPRQSSMHLAADVGYRSSTWLAAIVQKQDPFRHLGGVVGTHAMRRNAVLF